MPKTVYTRTFIQGCIDPHLPDTCELLELACLPEVPERAVRMVQQYRGEYPALWACIVLSFAEHGLLCSSQRCTNGIRHGIRQRKSALRRFFVGILAEAVSASVELQAASMHTIHL